MKNSALYPANLKKWAHASTGALIAAVLMFAMRIVIYHNEPAHEIISGDGGLLFTLTILLSMSTAALWTIFTKKKKDCTK